jgi:hypothetical protein
MDQVDRVIRFVFAVMLGAFHFVIALLATLSLWFRRGMDQVGIPGTFQSLILIAAAIALLLLMVRFAGGLLRIALLMLVILWVIEVLDPVVHFS